MSIAIMSYVWRYECSPIEKLVLLKLADLSSDDGTCWPSWNHLVDHTNLSRSTIYRTLEAMKNKGILSYIERPGTSNMYTVNVKKIISETRPSKRAFNRAKKEPNEVPITAEDISGVAETPPSSVTETPQGCHPDTGGSVTETRGECHPDTQSITEPPLEPSRKQRERASSQEYARRLRKIYDHWSRVTGGVTDKHQFSISMVRILDKNTDKDIMDSMDEYWRLLDNKKFLSIKRFAETYAAYKKRSKSSFRGIDPHSDMPVAEQARMAQ